MEHSDAQCAPRVSVQRLSLKDEGVIRACDIGDFSPRSTLSAALLAVTNASLEEGCGRAPDLASRR